MLSRSHVGERVQLRYDLSGSSLIIPGTSSSLSRFGVLSSFGGPGYRWLPHFGFYDMCTALSSMPLASTSFDEFASVSEMAMAFSAASM